MVLHNLQFKFQLENFLVNNSRMTRISFFLEKFGCLNSRNEDWCLSIMFWKYWVKISSFSTVDTGHFGVNFGPKIEAKKDEFLIQHFQNLIGRHQSSFEPWGIGNPCHRVTLSYTVYPCFWNIIENREITGHFWSIFSRSKVHTYIAILFVNVVIDVLDNNGTPRWNQEETVKHSEHIECQKASNWNCKIEINFGIFTVAYWMIKIPKVWIFLIRIWEILISHQFQLMMIIMMKMRLKIRMQLLW